MRPRCDAVPSGPPVRGMYCSRYADLVDPARLSVSASVPQNRGDSARTSPTKQSSFLGHPFGRVCGCRGLQSWLHQLGRSLAVHLAVRWVGEKLVLAQHRIWKPSPSSPLDLARNISGTCNGSIVFVTSCVIRTNSIGQS